MHINDLNKNDRARLINFGNTQLSYKRRLLSLGLTRGTEIKLIRSAPLGCPLQIELRGTSITLRKEEAAELEWELI